MHNAFDVPNEVNILYVTSDQCSNSYGVSNSISRFSMINASLGGNINLMAHELGHVMGDDGVNGLLQHTFGNTNYPCNGNICNDDPYSDTYWPDCNNNASGCGPNHVWGGSCPGVGTSNNIMGSNDCRSYLSPQQLARLHRSMITRASNRRHIICEPHAFNQTNVISVNATWESAKVINADIVIEPGVTLTVKCALYISAYVKIIVKQNARLIIDGGYLTARETACGDFWKGIEVWGTTNQHQFPANHPTYQGMLIVQNGGVIEHAREAVQLWKPGDWNSIGGVVRTYNAEFVNCRRAVRFMAYQNFNPGTGAPMANRSAFYSTTFTVDPNYRGGDDFFSHVSLWKVDGVNFVSCTFENLQNTVTQSNRLGTGINSIDAHFAVYANCATNEPWQGGVCPDYNMGVFRGLGTGIDARNSETARAFNVRHTKFENNICGIYANSVDGFSIKNNEFFVGHRPAVTLEGVPHGQFLNRHRGIFVTESSSISIDDNKFFKAQSPSHDGEAIVVGYTRENNEVVFRNEVHDVKYAYVGEGISADVANDDASGKGLWFLCNKNFATYWNFWSRIPPNDQVNNPNSHTIRTIQGAAARPADNTFDIPVNPTPPGAKHFVVQTIHPITYWHRNTGNYIPSTSLVTPGMLSPWVSTTIPENNCSSKTIPILENPNVAKSYLQSEKMAFANTRYLYEQLIDGGNTDETVQEIQESWPQDAWDLRAYLLSKSPYLSDTVLREIVRKDIMPEAMLTEVLVANPEGTRSNGFITWLQEKSGYPLSESMLGMVVASWDTRTYRDALENEMALHHGEMSAAATNLVDHYNSDTTGVRTDSLRWVWQQIRTPVARYAEALTFMDQGHLDSALLVMQAMAVEYRLLGLNAEEHQRMTDLIDFWQDVHGAGLNAQQLDSTAVQALSSIMGMVYDTPSSFISNTLCKFYGHCRPPLTGGDEGEPKLLPYTPLPMSWEHLAPTISLKPNPASNWVAIDYKLVGSIDDVLLTVQDSNGRSVFSRRLQNLEGQVVWDTRSMAQGIYAVTIRQGKKEQQSETLVIQR